MLLEGSTCPTVSRACTPPEREPAQDLSIHTAGTPRRGCCNAHTAQGTLGTPPRHWLHPQTWHVQPTEWCVLPSAPIGCDWCCPSHSSWLGKASVRYLSLARAAPTRAQDLGQAQRHRGPGWAVTNGGVSLPGDSRCCSRAAHATERGCSARAPGKRIVLNTPELGLLSPR